jgi:hypothetical protein
VHADSFGIIGIFLPDLADFASGFLKMPLIIPKPSTGIIDFFRQEAADPYPDRQTRIVQEPDGDHNEGPADTSRCPFGLDCQPGECALLGIFSPSTPVLKLEITLHFTQVSPLQAILDLAETHLRNSLECFADAEALLAHGEA